jgi:hypothetical protein
VEGFCDNSDEQSCKHLVGCLIRTKTTFSVAPHTKYSRNPLTGVEDKTCEHTHVLIECVSFTEYLVMFAVRTSFSYSSYFFSFCLVYTSTIF